MPPGGLTEFDAGIGGLSSFRLTPNDGLKRTRRTFQQADAKEARFAFPNLPDSSDTCRAPQKSSPQFTALTPTFRG
jgi:hypothetical protein